MKTELTLSPLAVQQIKERIALDGRSNLVLRLSIEGGGCSGLQYAYDLCQVNLINQDDQLDQDDQLILWQDTVTVISDMLSAHYLRGATLDYVQNLTAAKFVIHNPNTSMTCGCGSSFTLKTD